VTQKFERASAAAAPLDQVKKSVQSDLQYVSLQADGRTYGGWYRVLPDGKMELLALANMHSERRAESSPIDQARGMLADFIRTARSNAQVTGSISSNAPSVSGAGQVDPTTKTLGDVLYADRSATHVLESDWVALVKSIVTGDQLALYRLFERTNRMVFTLIMRLTNNRQAAEELTLDVFHDVWRQSSTYHPAMGSVVCWIMDQARSKAIQELRKPLTLVAAARDVDGTNNATESSRLQSALSELTPDEREIIEVLFFSELHYDELAAELEQSPETRTRVHFAMEKLRGLLDAGVQLR
jgi:RNA polymerase sigma-70 factor, ECF subfamily